MSPQSARLTATERLRRMLAIVPWVAAQPGGAAIDEICSRFDLDREQLQDCLDTAFMVGLHPYTPDALIDVIIDADRVQLRLPDFFTRPLRLTAEQTLALLVAGRSLLNVPGVDPDGPLARGLAKLSGSSSTDPNALVDVDLGQVPAALVPMLQDAVARRRRVALDYYSYGRDELTSREVDPWRVHAEQGQWYLEAWCHTSDDLRVFRLDRVDEAHLLDATFDAPEDEPPGEVFRPRAEDPRVTLELRPAARWVVDQYPVESVEDGPEDSVRVTLAVVAVPWLERLLVRLGPDVSIIDAPGALTDAHDTAARRILQRYNG